MDLFVWDPGGRPGGSVLVIQEIFGVGPYIRDVCQRLADAGYVAAAPDVFWRVHPGWIGAHTEAGVGESIGVASQLDPQLAVGDLVDALHHLHTLSGRSTMPAVLGFCLGGTLAWATAANSDPACCVSYYGSGVPDMLDLIDKVHCPTLFHFGNADAYIPNEGIDRVGAAIAGRAGFVVNVEDAGHAFDNHHAPMFWNESAASAAWPKTMAFLAANR